MPVISFAVEQIKNKKGGRRDRLFKLLCNYQQFLCFVVLLGLDTHHDTSYHEYAL